MTAFEMTVDSARCANGYYGYAAMQYEVDKRERNRVYDDVLQFSEECAKIPYGEGETVLTRGSAIIATYFLTGLFGTETHYSIRELARLARDKGYINQQKAPFEEYTDSGWFEDLNTLFELTCEKVYDATEVEEGLLDSRKLSAYVLQVRDDKYYGETELTGSHYLILMGVRGTGALIFDPGTGVNADRSLREIFATTMHVWRISD